MKLLDALRSNIARYLLLVALVPTCAVFVAFWASGYYAAREQAETELQAKGKLLISAIGQSVQYGLTSGNVAYLQDALGGITASDSSIAYLAVLDASGAVLYRYGTVDTALSSRRKRYERPLTTNDPVLDLFANTSAAPVLDPLSNSPTPFRKRVIGTFSLELDQQTAVEAAWVRMRRWLLLALLTALGSVVLGAVVAWRVAAPFRQINAGLRQLAQGNFNVRWQRRFKGDIGTLQNTVDNLAQALDHRRSRLQTAVDEKTGELNHALSELKRVSEERGRLIQLGNDLVEEERKQIAAELHDNLNASLLLMGIQAGEIQAYLAREANDVAQAAALAGNIQTQSGELYRSIRSLVRRIRPEIIDVLGLEAALRELLFAYDQGGHTCTFTFLTEGEIPEINNRMSIAIYRIVQEALSNVVKHAEASHCEVRMSCKDPQQVVVLTIVDDGRGFEVASERSGIGILSMTERAESVSGQLMVRATPSKGSVVTATFPL
jgi:two-component system, NarL family, sensor histidine kinase UhpB